MHISEVLQISLNLKLQFHIFNRRKDTKILLGVGRSMLVGVFCV